MCWSPIAIAISIADYFPLVKVQFISVIATTTAIFDNLASPFVQKIGQQPFFLINFPINMPGDLVLEEKVKLPIQFIANFLIAITIGHLIRPAMAVRLACFKLILVVF